MSSGGGGEVSGGLCVVSMWLKVNFIRREI